MYQIVFNEISAAEMAKIPKKLQLELLAEFQFLPENLDHLDSKSFGVIEREGKKLYRYRASDYRIYFARTAEGILVHRVLHKNTIGDFLFRSKLPLAEDEQLEQSTGFWKLIEEGERTRNEREVGERHDVAAHNRLALIEKRLRRSQIFIARNAKRQDQLRRSEI